MSLGLEKVVIDWFFIDCVWLTSIGHDPLIYIGVVALSQYETFNKHNMQVFYEIEASWNSKLNMLGKGLVRAYGGYGMP